MNKFLRYCRDRSQLSVEFLSEKFALTQDQVIQNLCTVWHKFSNPRVVGDLIVPNYSNQNWYYEVCDTKYGRGEYIKSHELQQHCLNNQTEDQHISVYGHDQTWKDNVDTTGSVSGGGGKLACNIFWLELDRKDYRKRANLQKAIDDAVKFKRQLLMRVPNAQVWIFTSGNNSAHIAINGNLFGRPVVSSNQTKVFSQLARNLTDGLRFGIKGDVTRMSEQELMDNVKQAYPQANITDDVKAETDFKWDAQIADAALENCDRNIYHGNALIRQPWSYHESGGNQKSIINESKPCKKLDIKEQPPYLLGEYLKAWKQKPKRSFNGHRDNYTTSYILDQYSDVFPDIKYRKPNSKGWIEDLYNPFYNDGNPDASIHVNKGHLKDFGSERFSMDFEQFLIKKQSL